MGKIGDYVLQWVIVMVTIIWLVLLVVILTMGMSWVGLVIRDIISLAGITLCISLLKIVRELAQEERQCQKTHGER